MRRIVWLLAVCGVVGAAVPWTLAAERFGVANTGTASTGTSTTSSQNRVGVPQRAGAVAPGAANNGTATTGAATTGRNNYSALFGETSTPVTGERSLPASGSLLETVSAERLRHPLGETSSATAASSGHPLDQATSLPPRKPLVDLNRELPADMRSNVANRTNASTELKADTQRPAEAAATPEVLNAAFNQNNTGSKANPIQQVAGDDFSSRPFPGSADGEFVAAPGGRGRNQFGTPNAGAQGRVSAPGRPTVPVGDTFGAFDDFRPLGDIGPQTTPQTTPQSDRLTDPISIPSGRPAATAPPADDDFWDLSDSANNGTVAPPAVGNSPADSQNFDPPARPRSGLTFGNSTNTTTQPPANPRAGIIPRPGQPIPPATPHPGMSIPRGPSRSEAAFGLSNNSQGGPNILNNTPNPNVDGVTILQDVANAKQSPTVTLEWRKKGALNVGQQCECELVIRNTGLIAAEDIEVAAFFPQSTRLVSAVPEPDTAHTYLGWQFQSLQPGAEEVIQIHLIPTERGELETTAEIRFTGAASTNFTVAEPLLSVEVTGPEQVMIGEPASHTITVTNPGTGVATNVVIEALIPKGLEHARGNRLIMELGSLNPTESRTMRLALAAVDGGNHVIQVQAKADSGIAETDVAEVKVVAPSLIAEIEGPGLRYLGRTATYVLRVRNDGAIATDNVRLMHKVPEGFELTKTDRGTQYDKANRLLNWFVGRLNPGQSSEIHVTFDVQKLGDFTHFARVTSEHGAISDAQLNTSVEGSPSLVMEVHDIDDPVEVGVETAYEITVKNEGSAPAKNVAIGCELPTGMTLIKASGPVDSFNDRNQVIFRPVTELAPGNSITYRVLVRGIENGHHRFRAQLSSDSIPEPLTKDELTRFYGQ